MPPAQVSGADRYRGKRGGQDPPLGDSQEGRPEHPAGGAAWQCKESPESGAAAQDNLQFKVVSSSAEEAPRSSALCTAVALRETGSRCVVSLRVWSRSPTLELKVTVEVEVEAWAAGRGLLGFGGVPSFGVSPSASTWRCLCLWEPPLICFRKMIPSGRTRRRAGRGESRLGLGL